MLKLRIEDIKRFCKLKEKEVVTGCDGETYYIIRREGDALIIKERHEDEKEDRAIDNPRLM